MLEKIPSNIMSLVGNEEKYLLEALRSGKWSGRGVKTLALEKFVRQKLGVEHAFFVTSGSSALEIGCLLADIGPGDEVITPSFGFVSAANAIFLRGAKPVFADIDRQTWNISAETVEPLISKKTKAIMPVHYAGSTAGIEDLRVLCKERGIFLIEDAAQSLGAYRNGKIVGATPWVSCFSLHDTKNVACGEGGLITTDSEAIAGRIEIIIEKGTDRQRFFRGQVDKYTWVDKGASYIASDLLAAVALGQIEKLDEITEKRRNLYIKIREGLSSFSKLQWQLIPEGVLTNGHIAAFVIDPKIRAKILDDLKNVGVSALFHYVPLHDAPFAKKTGVAPVRDLMNTRWVSEGLVRLPLFFSMSDAQADEVIGRTAKVISKYV